MISVMEISLNVPFDRETLGRLGSSAQRLADRLARAKPARARITDGNLFVDDAKESARHLQTCCGQHCERAVLRSRPDGGTSADFSGISFAR
jgi:hypothetical protein